VAPGTSSRRLISALAPAAVAVAFQTGCGGEPESQGEPPGTQATVAFVADGDTVELTDGRRVRLVQIDAPELFGECYGPAARLTLRHLLPDGAPVDLTRDPALDDRDEHGRLLRYVEAGKTNVNLELVRRGAAAPYFYRGGRGRHAVGLERAAQAAVRERRGLWRVCPQAHLRPGRALAAGPG
jgi:micrococcal nuclease